MIDIHMLGDLAAVLAIVVTVMSGTARLEHRITRLETKVEFLLEDKQQG